MSQQLVVRQEETGGALLAVHEKLGGPPGRGEPTLAALRRFPAQPPEYAEFPEDLHPQLLSVLRKRGYERLFVTSGRRTTRHGPVGTRSS